MLIVVLVLSVVAALLSGITIFVVLKNKQSSEISAKDKQDLISGFNNSVALMNQTIASTQKIGNDAVVASIKQFEESLLRDQQKLETGLIASEKALEDRVMKLIEQLDKRMNEISKMQEEKLNQIQTNTQNQIKSMQEDNNKQLDKMRETVDEKLSKTINDRFEQTFKVLSEQLESVYKSLGEMQTVATSVGNLTKVLSNVKTTGIFGEIQLGAILDQMLTKDQYETNFITATGHDPVEFAIKFPGQEDGEFVYLPIDSKFPLTVYTDLYSAYENNDVAGIKTKKEQLKNTIKAMAKDIKTKYVYPPKTTDFAVMFLPIEGLYAEVAKMGLIEELQRSYNVTVAGPTTMSALLNSLQMGFRTLAIQKKSGEVWKILGAVKTEFGKFNEIIKKIQDRFESTSKDFDNLIGTRSRVLESKLKSVERLGEKETKFILNMDNPSESTGEE